MTSKPQHTPGPWELFERDRVTQYGATDEVGPFVIGVGEITIAETQDDGEPGVALADARLIAAAPDLLAACEAYVNAWPEDNTPHVIAMRAAIAKARGGAA